MIGQQVLNRRCHYWLRGYEIGEYLSRFPTGRARRCTAMHHHQRRTVLSEAVATRMFEYRERYDEVMEKLNNGDASLAKELSILNPVVRIQEQLDELNEEEISLRSLMEEASGDAEMEEECKEELEALEAKRTKLEKRALDAVLPRDPDDALDAILEVRAGTGGDEASLFAAELMEAYSKDAKGRGYKFEFLEYNKSDRLGGIKGAIASVSGGSSYGGYGALDDRTDEEDVDTLAGLGAYGYFKMESGVHRVQRVPINDVRIHTSACSVAVLPSESTSDNGAPSIPMSDLRIETMRASGAGGQHVNTTDSAIRITHLPTGITASIQDERSQHMNKTKALKLIAARVRDAEEQQLRKERGDARSALMGGGDRSERIRTYNFPQDRVTDHRSKQTSYNIEALFLGGLDKGLVSTFAPGLRAMNKDELIRHLAVDT